MFHCTEKEKTCVLSEFKIGRRARVAKLAGGLRERSLRDSGGYWLPQEPASQPLDPAPFCGTLINKQAWRGHARQSYDEPSTLSSHVDETLVWSAQTFCNLALWLIGTIEARMSSNESVGREKITVNTNEKACVIFSRRDDTVLTSIAHKGFKMKLFAFIFFV